MVYETELRNLQFKDWVKNQQICQQICWLSSHKFDPLDIFPIFQTKKNHTTNCPTHNESTITIVPIEYICMFKLLQQFTNLYLTQWTLLTMTTTTNQTPSSRIMRLVLLCPLSKADYQCRSIGSFKELLRSLLMIQTQSRWLYKGNKTLSTRSYMDQQNSMSCPSWNSWYRVIIKGTNVCTVHK